MFDLDKLWKKRLRVILQSIAAGERSHREIASIASHIGADYHGRFLIELLQNACDQAKKVGLRNSCVTIVRTEHFIAVTNQGEPFTEPGIEEITSLGLSSKDPQVDIGNKGFGFKAVFQITEEPEIYSSLQFGDSFRATGSSHFGLNRRVFKTEFFRERVSTFVEESLRRMPDLADEIRVTTGCDDVLGAILAEVAQAAPFKFPIPLGEEHLNRRLGELQFPPGREVDSETLIVLPLLPGEETERVVNQAFVDLYQTNAPAVLFLDGVGRVEVVDRVRGVNTELLREMVSQTEELERGAKFQSWRTWTTELEGDARSTDWWVAFRDIGAYDENEQAAVAQAAAELPGENWHHVRHARVAVALPHPSKDRPAGTPLEPNGLFCIGLPTADWTGTPFWIDGRFHANISRTGIDLTKSYNRLLFDEAVKLVVGLVERLKIDSIVNSRRAVTQAMTCGDGHLARELKISGLTEGRVVLSQDGLTFLTASDLSLPDSSDMEMYNALAGNDHGSFGFVLAEASLMLNARDLLDQMRGRASLTVGPDARFLQRPGGQQSLLESGTRKHRAAGPRFWEPFFDWLSRRFTADALKDQDILPVGDDALVGPGSRVFFRPWIKAGRSGQSEEDVASDEIPADLANALLFLDERALPVRDPSGANLTLLARRLATDGGTQCGLIRRPRRLELLNDLIAPRLVAAADIPEQRSTALDLLRLVSAWTQALSDSARAQLRIAALRVPVKSQGGVWSWVSPIGVYFGDDWLDPETNRLLSAAYGKQPGRRLVEWTEFAAASGSPQSDRSFWINGLTCLEVNRAPRVRKAPKNRPAPLCSWSYNELSVVGVTPPWRELASLYQDYLEVIRKRTANTKTGQTFDLKDLTWVDGLEDEESRQAVVELMLLNPDKYEPYTETFLQRSDGSDAKQVLSLWAYSLIAKEWSVIPTERGLRPTTKCWLLETEQATKLRKRYSFLDCVPSRYREAQRLLSRLGGHWLNDAPAACFVTALQDLADGLVQVRGSQYKSVEALAEDLYARLNRRGVARLRAESFAKMLARPVPLKRGDRLFAVELSSLDCLYFDDDPNRSRFIQDFASHFCVPVAIRSGYADLFAAFRDVLGETHVVRTSEALIDTGFTPAVDPPEEIFSDYVNRQFPEIPVMVDLGLVMVLADRDPSTEDFKRVWKRLADAVLRFGHFPPESRTLVFCESAELAHPIVLTSLVASRYQVLESVWPILGSAARYILAAYAAAVQTNGVDTFFADKGFGSVERENMESALGMAAPGPFEHMRSAIFAVWRRHNPSVAIEQFHDLWKARSRKSEDVADWTPCFELQDVLDDPKATDAEGQNLEVLRAAAVSIPEWQQARRELDDLPWRFEKSIERYSEARNVVTATLMVVAARSATTDLAVAQRVLDELSTTGVPESIAHDMMTTEAALRANIDNGAEIASKQDSEALDILASRIRRLQKEPPASLDAVFFEDIPRREVDTYLERPAPLREQDAREVVSNVLKVTSALAAILGEEFDCQLIQTDDRVAALSSGWWSNRFTVLYALRRSIERIAPKTASRMSEQTIFHAPRSWQASWSMLPELGPVLTTVPVRPEPKKTLLGQQFTKDEILQDLAKASAGKLGQALSDAAKQAMTPDVFRGHHHAPATPPERRAGGAARPTTGRGRSGQTETDNELTGILGEGFVFEYLKGSLPGFDESCWRSGSRKAYGFADIGRDDLGYDFEYADSHGCLSGRADKPCCYIEVKATTSDGSEAFPITANEWEKAQWCHENPNEALYVIIRIERVTSQAPAVWDILIDPVQLWTKKEIAISHHDLWVYVGRPLHPEPPSAAGA